MIKMIHGSRGRAKVLLWRYIQGGKYEIKKCSSLSSSSSLLCSSSLGPRYDGGKRYMSDNLLGYNPMAQHNSVNQNKDDKKKNKIQPAFGVDSNTEGGGVWAQTSAKRDKLAELKTEMVLTDKSLNKSNLDNAATPRELLDLELADGLRCVATLVDNGNIAADIDDSVYWKEWNDYLKELQNVSPLMKDGGSLDKSQWHDHVSSLLQIVIRAKELWEQRAADKQKKDDADNTNDIGEHHPLIYMRDFLPYPHPDDLPVMTKEEANIPADVHNRLSVSSSSTATISPLEECVDYLRLILVQQLLEEWSTNNGDDIWKEYVLNVSDSDIDRAAVKQNSNQIDVKTATTSLHQEQISISNFINVMQAYATGSCSDRVRALWQLKDKDNDGLLDQEEMNAIVHASYRPVHKALPLFLNECVNIHPLDLDPFLQDDSDQPPTSGFRGWRRRRRLAKETKILNKTMEKTLKKHLEDEVEIAHRLRCIYAWADKAHQEGKIESVLVDDSSPQQSQNKKEDEEEKGLFAFGGKKRFVELNPKISYEEFLTVQKEHFPHLDRAMREYCNSYKEELWLLQGQGRQRAEVKRDSALFLLVVSVIDLAIVMG